MNVPKDIEERSGFLVFYAPDVARAFDSCTFSYVLLEVHLKGFDAAVITCLRHVYRNLKAGIKYVCYFRS